MAAVSYRASSDNWTKMTMSIYNLGMNSKVVSGKILFRSIVLITVCVVILLAGFSASSNLCTKDRSFLCSVYSFGYNVNSSGIDVTPDNNFLRLDVISDITPSKDFVVSIFHPPRIAS